MASSEDVSREAAIAAWTRWLRTWTPFIWNWPTPEDYYDYLDLDGFGGEY